MRAWVGLVLGHLQAPCEESKLPILLWHQVRRRAMLVRLSQVVASVVWIPGVAAAWVRDLDGRHIARQRGPVASILSPAAAAAYSRQRQFAARTRRINNWRSCGRSWTDCAGSCLRRGAHRAAAAPATTRKGEEAAGRRVGRISRCMSAAPAFTAAAGRLRHAAQELCRRWSRVGGALHYFSASLCPPRHSPPGKAQRFGWLADGG